MLFIELQYCELIFTLPYGRSSEVTIVTNFELTTKAMKPFPFFPFNSSFSLSGRHLTTLLGKLRLCVDDRIISRSMMVNARKVNYLAKEHVSFDRRIYC